MRPMMPQPSPLTKNMPSDSSITKSEKSVIDVSHYFLSFDRSYIDTNKLVEEKLKGREGDDDDESSDESEDEDGFLATEDLDAQISATLNAIRTKDPRLYDKDFKFIQLAEEEAQKEKKEKPVFLRDYQRERLLKDAEGGSYDEDSGPRTYAQEQDSLKKSIISEINAAGPEDDSDSDDGGFVKKAREPVKMNASGVHPSRAAAIKISDVDVQEADRDPEMYLSNFMSSRAWIPEEGGRWQAFDSDDSEDEDRADEFEQAYNMRFEDPSKSNEVLKSYARDFASARSVRREEKTGRQRQRDLAKEKKEEEKRQLREDKARLRKLKLEETEEKLRKVKQAAGSTGKDLSEKDWMAFLDDAWDNDKWEEEMRKRFGEDYYAMDDNAIGSEDEGAKSTKHPKKPKWDDDIDIKDIVPDFDDDAEPAIALSDEEEDDSRPSKKRKTADHKRERLESQKKARQERSRVEALVDSKLELTNHDLLASNSDAAFRYRETSPQAFGMTARDILLAPSDKDLNEFAGLKKLASFRDPEKKRRDKKRLGKKARLREWRRGTFGREFEREGPTYGFERFAEDEVVEPAEPAKTEDGSSKKKRKRSKGKKVESLEE